MTAPSALWKATLGNFQSMMGKAAWAACLAIVCCIALAGCSSQSLVEAKGKVTYRGEPLKLGPQGVLEVSLIPEQRDERGEYTSFTAEVNYADGSFEVPGKVPPGKYKISVQQLDPYPMNDKLKGAFYMDKSQIVREITGEPITIDVSKPTG
jgi:hypothetical protein